MLSCQVSCRGGEDGTLAAGVRVMPGGVTAILLLGGLVEKQLLGRGVRWEGCQFATGRVINRSSCRDKQGVH